MVVYLRSGGLLKEKLKPDVDAWTRRVEVPDGLTIGEILDSIQVPAALVAFALSDGRVRRLDHKPVDGERITLQPPVAGG